MQQAVTLFFAILYCMRMYADGAHTSHHPQRSVMDTQNKALGLWGMGFC
jgi:hypothetical protein